MKFRSLDVASEALRQTEEEREITVSFGEVCVGSDLGLERVSRERN